MTDLIRTARRTISTVEGRPSQADLRRAISTAYYAMFDTLARLCANEIVGGTSSKRATSEWARVYRALDHGKSAQALDQIDPRRKQLAKRGQASAIDPKLEAFCNLLDDMRLLRLQADYDPTPLNLKLADVHAMIAEAETTIDDLHSVPSIHRRALAFACVVPLRRAQ